MFPGSATVGRAIEAASGTTATQAPGRALDFVHRSKGNVGIVWIKDDVDGTGLVVLVKNLFPCLSAIRRTENSALSIGAICVSQSSDQHDVRITRVDDDGADVLRIFQTNVRPGFAAVG